MFKPIEEAEREGRRLLILELLIRSEKRSASDRVLSAVLRDMGWETSRDVLRSELLWMQRQGLVTLKHTETEIWSAHLTERGDMCGRGETQEPGVARPALG